MKKNQKWPKISVITPSYNQGQFIEETIKSVIEQNYPNLEYIIIDGGSTDNSVSIIKKYAKKYPKIIRWVSEKDRGQSDAINKGLRMSTGEILCYLNSDDCFTKKTLFKVAEFFRKNPHAEWLTGDYKIVNDKGKEMHSSIGLYKKLWRKFPYKFTLLLTNYINQPSTFWKRKVYEKVGEFEVKYRYNMDFDYWIRIFNAGFRLYVLEEKLSEFRIHRGSINSDYYREQFDHMLLLIKKYSRSRFIYWFNRLHYGLISFIYQFRK
jgi:glycosyltransferase involved in cell wall biosynthesis